MDYIPTTCYANPSPELRAAWREIASDPKRMKSVRLIDRMLNEKHPSKKRPKKRLHV